MAPATNLPADRAAAGDPGAGLDRDLPVPLIWNDLLVALTFSGGTEQSAPITQRLSEMAGSRGGEWQRLTAGAFVSMVIPLIVFISLQRYFVRGLLAGSVKG